MKIRGWLVVAWLVVLPGCSACDDPHGSAPDGPTITPGSGGFPGPHAGFSGSVSGSSGGSGTGSAGFPFPGTGGMACGPFGCGMCFECSPGCVDCGSGICTCTDGGAPVALPWDPPFDAVGDVGYRDSTEPWCSGINEVLSLDVWSDERGVFTVVSGVGPGPVGAEFGDEDAGVASPPDDVGPNPMNGFIDPSQFQARTEVWWNDGQSWKVSVDEVSIIGRHELSGVPGSLLFVNGDAPEGSEFGDMPGFTPCELGIIDSNGIDCLDLDPVTNVFVAGSQRAAAVMGGSRLLLYDGERWRGDTAPIPFPVTEVWADGDSVLAAGRAGIVLWREGDGWRLEDPGTLAHITSLWGTARTDVWAGTSDGHILHYDGVTWTEAGTLGGVTCDFAPPVLGIWGSGDAIYFHSATHLARIVGGGELETLANWSCSPNAGPHAMKIAGLWGNGPDEVFVSIIDNVRSVNTTCGPAHVVYYDGESFHRM